MVKKLSKVLLCLMVAFSGMSFINAEETTPEIITAKGEQIAYLTGDDWGVGVSKTIITLEETIDHTTVSKDDFIVKETKAGGEPTTRTIVDAYMSDANGKKSTSSRGTTYITIELLITPEEGSAFKYAGLNIWATPYHLDVQLAEGATISTKGSNQSPAKTIATLDIESEIAIDGDGKISKQLEGVEFYGSRDDDNGDAFVYTAEDNTEVVVPYAFYKPAQDGYNHPIFIWNHGAGEGGTDPQITVLANEVTALWGEEFQSIMGGCYVIAPQVPKGAQRDANRALAIKALVEELAEKYDDIDLNRVYVGGCSMGGGMTMTSLVTTPEFYTAAVPICPAGSPTEEKAAIIKDIPMWFVHALNDPLVKYSNSTEKWIDLLTTADAAEVHTSLFDDMRDLTERFWLDSDGKLTLENTGTPYQYNGHWSWVNFDNNDCYEGELNCWEWLAQQVKGDPTADITGTQRVTVIGEEWGAGVTKTTIKFDGTIAAESVSAEDFRIVENKDGALTRRTVTAAYTSDADGNKVTTDSEYVTIEMAISPSVGNPITWSMSTWTNSWPNSYELVISLLNGQTLTAVPTARAAGDTTIDVIDVDSLIDVSNHKTQNYPQLENVSMDTYTHENGTVIPYGLYKPEDDGHKNSIFVWNHGVGERGTDPKIAMYGNEVTGLWSDEVQEIMDGMYVLVAQVPSNGSTNAKRADAIVDLVKKLAAENSDIDLNRVYVAGCSMGGGMTTTIINNHADFFAAAIPVCPAGVANAEAVNGLPVWYIHAENDGTVNIKNTNDSIAALNALGSETHTSIFPDVTGTYKNEDGTFAKYDGHWSWTYLFNNQCYDEDGLNLFEWLSTKAGKVDIEADVQLYAEVTDAGQVVNMMTIDFGEGNEPTNVTEDNFVVHATASTTHITAGTDVISYGDYSIDRTIEKVEVEGSVVTLYFNEAEGATLAYLAAGRNVPAELTYTVQVNQLEMADTEYNNWYKVTSTIAEDIIDEETAKFESVIIEDGINYQFFNAGKDAESLIVWFHGNGEGDYLDSDNNVAQMLANRGTVAWATKEAQDIFGKAHVMSFQAPDHWYNAKNNGLLEQAYEEIMDVVEKYGIDPEKILVSGCSAGGFMTTRMIIKYPDLFAAAAINCPALDIANLRAGEGVTDATPTDEELASIKDSRTAIWLVQGETDSSVKPEDCSMRLFKILTEGKEITETRVEEEIQSSYTTYETEDGKYVLSIYDTVDVVEDETGRGKGKLVFAEDYNHDGELEEVKYSDHWSWIYTLRNNPTNAEETTIWKWMADNANIVSTTTGDSLSIAPLFVAVGLSLCGIVFLTLKKRKEETNA